MRRSAAPSQLGNAAKKRRFITPFLSVRESQQVGVSTTGNDVRTDNTVVDTENKDKAHNSERSKTEILSLIKKSPLCTKPLNSSVLRPTHRTQQNNQVPSSQNTLQYKKHLELTENIEKREKEKVCGAINVVVDDDTPPDEQDDINSKEDLTDTNSAKNNAGAHIGSFDIVDSEFLDDPPDILTPDISNSDISNPKLKPVGLLTDDINHLNNMQSDSPYDSDKNENIFGQNGIPHLPNQNPTRGNNIIALNENYIGLTVKVDQSFQNDHYMPMNDKIDSSDSLTNNKEGGTYQRTINNIENHTTTANSNIQSAMKKPSFGVKHGLTSKPKDGPRAVRPGANVVAEVNVGPGANVRPGANAEPVATAEQGAKYFNVMWCKRSNKKHKKWEGDAILQAKGRSVSLFDMEGKEIGKATGYKIAELQNLTEGETLPIGGKQIEVMGYVTPEQFSSGKCFTSAGQVEIQQEVNPKPKSFKPFVKPTKLHANGGNPLHRAKIVKVSGPRFDPTMVDALVMPRPNQAHQWQLNKEGLAVIDVVVDPYISTHLRPHQRDGVVFLYECIMGFRNFNGNGAILADDMGLGKTLQCISLVWTLLKQGPYGGKAVLKKILIVTPGSLVKNWMREFKKWLGTERIQVFTVDQDNKVQEFIKCGIQPVMIISYEMFIRSLESLKAVTFDLVICDEGHRLKNTTIKTTSSLMSLPTRRRIVLTGTPIQNDLQEFFSIVEFTNPGVLGSSSAFRRVYEDPIITSKQPRATSEEKEIGGQRAAELNRLTGMFVLRRTQEINNRYLPPKVELVIFCPPTELQLNIYRKLIASRLVRSCFSRNSNGSPHLMCIAAMKKLCNHPWLLFEKAKEVEEAFNLDSENDEESLYQDIFSLYPDQFEELILHPAASGKLTVLQGILQELSASKERVVLVSNYTQTLNILEHMCQRSNYTFVRLDGQTPTAKRQQLVENFNSKYSDTFIFLLSSKAGGVGLNLIGASRLVLYDIDWNPANDLQAMARVWRDGQRKKVYIYRLFTTGTIEEKVYQRQISKQGLSGAVMDSKTTIQNVKFSLEDLKDLFMLRDETDCDTHDLLNCKCETSSNIESSTGQENNARRCQLGATKNTKQKKNLSMDELMSWQHIPRNNLESLNQDYHLGNSEAGISYVFWQESYKGSE